MVYHLWLTDLEGTQTVQMMLCLLGTVSQGGIYYIADRKNKKKAIIMTHPQPHQGFVEIYGADPEPENNLGRKFFGI